MQCASGAAVEAQLYLSLVEADCLLIENAGRSGIHADASTAVAQLEDAATTQTVVRAFDSYAGCVTTMLTHLATVSAPSATAVAEQFQGALPVLGQAVESLAAAAHDELSHLRQGATL